MSSSHGGKAGVPEGASVPTNPIVPLPDAPIQYPPAEEPEVEPEVEPEHPAAPELPAEPVTAPAAPSPALPVP